MGAQAWPFNQTGTSGAPAYPARQLRQLGVSPFIAMGSAARPLGAKSGIRVGTPASIATITGSGPYGWQLAPFPGVIDAESNAAAGPYTYSFDSNQTGSIATAGAAARQDRLDVQLSDSDEGDGSGTKSVQIIYTQGAATGGALPAAPARSHRVATINVPTSGAPTISWAPDWSDNLGEWTFNTSAELTAYTTAITAANVPANQRATVISDTTATNNGDYAWSGSLWLPTAGPCMPHARYLKSSAFTWNNPAAIHTWDTTPVEGAVSGFTVSGGTQRFTIAYPGLWRFAGALGLAASGYGNVQVRVNGATHTQFNSPSTSSVSSARFDWEKQLAVGDYVEFYIVGSPTAGVLTDLSNNLCFLNIDYLHA